MSQSSPILSLPYIQPAQAQKHVTHNEALRILDAVTQLSVLDTELTAPPGQVAAGDRYIVAVGATGGWAGQDRNIAVFVDSTWQFFVPSIGWRADVADTGEVFRFDGTDWQITGGVQDLQNLPGLGVGTVSDNTNRLAVSAEATLLNHAGAGHQLKLNKAAAGNTTSLLFQTGFSGRAEMGTAGTDDFAIKVSADGTVFRTALRADASSGGLQLPSGQCFFEDVLVANDAAWSIDIPWSDPSRILMWLSDDTGGDFALFAITGPLAGAANFTEVFSAVPGGMNYLGGALAGTTGPAAAINVSVDVSGAQPRFWLENRLGSDRTFTLATLGR